MTADRRFAFRIALAALAVSTSRAALAGTVTTTADTVMGSLRYAIAHAFPGETITFDPSIAGKTIVLADGELGVNLDLTIDGGASGMTISGLGHTTRILRVGFTAAATLHANNLTLRDGNLRRAEARSASSRTGRST